MITSLLFVLPALAGIDPPETQVLVLQFEEAGWDASNADAVHADTEVFHGGERALRLESDNADGATFVTRSFPIRFGGKKVELRGFLKTEDVEGHAGLWLREDGTERGLEFDNMKKQRIDGTNEWTEYRVELPLHPDARDLYFGALVTGKGKIWVDDLELLVDGQPVWDAETLPQLITVFDTDTEFDDGSGIDLADLTHVQHDNLVRLGKVWGFLKYHHPKAREGTLHWDYELFRVLPDVLGAEDTQAGRSLLAEWVADLGEVPTCDPCAEPADEVHLPVEVDWISDSELLGADLSASLMQIHERRPKTGEQFYVGIQPGVGNPDFSMEPDYGHLETLDPGYRLLTAFRFWNIISYWFPYRDLIDSDWDRILARTVWEVAAAEDDAQFSVAMIRMIAEVKDTHTNLWGSLEHRLPIGKCKVPARVRFVEDDRAIVWSLPDTAGDLKVGDIVTAVDGVTVDDLVVEWTPLYAASNRPTRLRDIGRNLLGGECGPAQITVDRAGETLDLETERVEYEDDGDWAHSQSEEAFHLIDDDIAYLSLDKVTNADVKGYLKAAKGTKGWVIDIRNYPNEFVVFSLGSRILADKEPFATFTMVDLDNPSGFKWQQPVTVTPKGKPYAGRIAILVDEATQSSAEYHTMAFRNAPGAVVIGSTTAAADGNVSPIPLPGPFRSLITGIGVFYPDKSATQQIGILPDIEALPTVEGIRAGRDEVLEVALGHLRSD